MGKLILYRFSFGGGILNIFKRNHILVSLIAIIAFSFFIYFIKPVKFSGNSNKNIEIAEAKKGMDEINSKIVYLTFDDGPTKPVTDKLLDTLKEYDVKATFFVVGKEIQGCEEVLKRMHSEGHVIGIHTYSHSFKKIYKNKDRFINENVDTAKLVCDVTGFMPNILRFPGGSHNRLDDEFLDEIHEKGFRVSDWTNSCEDGVNPNASPDKLYKNSLKKIVSRKKFPGLIILMHSNCNNENTIKALPKIINHYKSLGYEFRVIDENTPEYYSE